MTKEDLFKQHNVSSYKIKVVDSKVLYVFGDTEYSKDGETFLEVGKVAKKKEFGTIRLRAGGKIG